MKEIVEAEVARSEGGLGTRWDRRGVAWRGDEEQREQHVQQDDDHNTTHDYAEADHLSNFPHP